MREMMGGTKGIVYLVGAGPGDQDLVTRKALICLARCDVVVYDFLASIRILSEVGPGCERIYVGKRAGFHSVKQEEINRVLIEKAREGKIVVRLKGGDPLVFGRGGEEVLALAKEGIPYEVVPGVTSVVAALSSAGIPITHRGVSRSFHVMTGHTFEAKGGLSEDFHLFAKLSGTLVFLMGLKNLDLIVNGLIEQGKSAGTPAALIENGTLPNQRVIRGELAMLPALAKEYEIHSPAIIVVGEVVAFRMEATVSKPLRGIVVGLIGTDSFVRRLSERLGQEGADTRCLLSMNLEPVEDVEMLLRVMEKLEEYTWLVFTSANAIRLFFQDLWDSGRDRRALGRLKLAVVGPSTEKELEGYGFRADFMPSRYCSETLGQELAARLGTGDRVLISGAAGGSDLLARALSESGIFSETIILYDVKGGVPAAKDLEVMSRSGGYLVFGSGSGVSNFLEAVGDKKEDIFSNTRVACIGTVTADVLSGYGIQPDITAEEFSIRGLSGAICQDAQINLKK